MKQRYFYILELNFSIPWLQVRRGNRGVRMRMHYLLVNQCCKSLRGSLAAIQSPLYIQFNYDQERPKFCGGRVVLYSDSLQFFNVQNLSETDAYPEHPHWHNGCCITLPMSTLWTGTIIYIYKIPLVSKSFLDFYKNLDTHDRISSSSWQDVPFSLPFSF